MSLLYLRRKSVFIAGTALLGASVALLDWVFKIAGLKIPFPLMPDLRFDFLGIPMILATFLFGLISGIIACTAAFISISFRSPPSALLKFLAELFTILGVYLVLKIRGTHALGDKKTKSLATVSGVALRVVVMALANVLLLPLFFPKAYTTQLVIILVPAISLFNVIQGTISAFGGFLIYEAVVLRLPSLKPNNRDPQRHPLSDREVHKKGNDDIEHKNRKTLS